MPVPNLVGGDSRLRFRGATVGIDNKLAVLGVYVVRCLALTMAVLIESGGSWMVLASVSWPAAALSAVAAGQRSSRARSHHRWDLLRGSWRLQQRLPSPCSAHSFFFPRCCCPLLQTGFRRLLICSRRDFDSSQMYRGGLIDRELRRIEVWTFERKIDVLHQTRCPKSCGSRGIGLEVAALPANSNISRSRLKLMLDCEADRPSARSCSDSVDARAPWTSRIPGRTHLCRDSNNAGNSMRVDDSRSRCSA